MASTFKQGPQDLPPKGGYAPIQIERIQLRTIIGGRLGIGLFLLSSATGCYLYFLRYKQVKKHQVEMRSSRLAIQPLLQAERDRALLKQLIIGQKEEADLMKVIPTWEVGTFFGEPIYHTKPKDEFREPDFEELVIHSDPKSYYQHQKKFIFL
ncbi:NADH dehydrogenase (ubiquinone) B16.6 subunit [Calliopsis andreniformis]|uniref:NADH dehydrogenase (ubiquinone) B16.6 subunit n=1 Tax=Calliopsis andreniformis TaxID=337506 RepID=UPI003FCCA5DA